MHKKVNIFFDIKKTVTGFLHQNYKQLHKVLVDYKFLKYFF